MGGEGAMMQAIHSLRNNSRRSKREAFDGWSPSDKESQGIKIEPVSEEVLQQIRDKLEKQKKKEKFINFTIITLSIIATIIFFFIFFYYFQNTPGISDDFLYRNKR
ncbi:MAG: hypothetical protein CL613_03210 [Aquimarina sp.]|nr:hypothetical protein [Aquimarina sp.]